MQILFLNLTKRSANEIIRNCQRIVFKLEKGLWKEVNLSNLNRAISASSPISHANVEGAEFFLLNLRGKEVRFYIPPYAVPVPETFQRQAVNS